MSQFFRRVLVPVCLLWFPLSFVSAQAAAPTVGWDKNVVSTDAGANAVGYKVHIGTVTGVYTQHFDVGNTNTYLPIGLAAGVKYFAAVTAYNLAKIEGAPSNEVAFTIPVPTPTPTPVPTPATPTNFHLVIEISGTGTLAINGVTIPPGWFMGPAAPSH